MHKSNVKLEIEYLHNVNSLKNALHMCDEPKYLQ